MKTKDIITYAAIAVGAYGVYWYITNYGPNGSVTDATGKKIAASWWDSWFGGTVTTSTVPAIGTGISTPAPVSTTSPSVSVSTSTPQPATATQIAQIAALLKTSELPAFQAMLANGLTSQQADAMIAIANATVQAPPVSALLPAKLPPVQSPPVDIRSALIAAAGGINAMLTASQWNFYYNQINNTPNAQWLLGDNGAPMTVDSYILLRQSNGLFGLSAITPTTSMQTSTAAPKRSPWGRIASTDRVGMNWKN